MIWDIILWGILPFAIMLVACALPAFYPERIVQLQGLFYRKWYKEYLRMSDEAIDQLPRLATDTWMMGTWSHFLNRAPEHPEEFPKLLEVYRVIGCVTGSIIFLSLVLIIFSAISGKLTIVH